MSKNIKRDEKGNPILRGAILYQYSVKPKSKRTDTTDLKNQANDRLLLLMKRGAIIDRLANPTPPPASNEHERKALEFQKEYAESPKIVQFAHHNNKLKDLQRELSELIESDNKRRIEFLRPALEQQIKEQEEIMRELFLEIKREKIILKGSE